MRIQRPWSWLFLDLSPLFLIVVLGATQLRDLPPLVPLAIIAVLTLFAVLARTKLELTPTHLSEQVLLGQVRHAIPWSRIQHVDVHHTFGVPQVRIVSDDGGVHDLPVPRPIAWFWPDQRFDAGYQQISQWWLDHRGARWRPSPPPGTPGERPAPLDDPWVLDGWVWRGRSRLYPERDVRK